MRRFFLLMIGLSLCNLAFAATFTLVNNGTKTSISSSDLAKLPICKVSTSTNFTPMADFEGASLRSFTAKYNIKGKLIRVFALDDYSYTIPLSELKKYNAIIAYKKNGKNMPVNDLGPFAIIYPRDQHPELNQLEVNAKTVWQISKIEVIP